MPLDLGCSYFSKNWNFTYVSWVHFPKCTSSSCTNTSSIKCCLDPRTFLIWWWQWWLAVWQIWILHQSSVECNCGKPVHIGLSRHFEMLALALPHKGIVMGHVVIRLPVICARLPSSSSYYHPSAMASFKSDRSFRKPYSVSNFTSLWHCDVLFRDVSLL